MVFEDLSLTQVDSKKTARLAPIVDRLLSVVVDFSLFWPFFTLLMSTVLKKLQYRYYAAPDSAEFWVLLGVSAFGFAALTVLAQGLFWSVLGATPGQMFFQLRVVDIHTQRAPTLHAALLRSFLFMFELLLLGIPLLEVFSHPGRRAFHDRAVDTDVVTLKSVGIRGPQRFEIQMTRGFFTLCLAFMLVWAFGTVTRYYSAALRGQYKEAELADAEYLCPDVPAREEGGGRLDAALALYLTGSLSVECLETETDFAFWKGERNDQSWAAFALAVAKKKDLNAKKAYLQQACDKDAQGFACQMADWWTSDEGGAAPANTNSWTRTVMSIQRAEEANDTETWSKELAHIPADFDLAEFMEVQKVKLLWAEKKFEQAQGGYSVIWDQLSARPQRELSSRLCSSEITQDCSVRSYKYCRDLEASIKNSPEEIVDSNWILAMAEDKACRDVKDSAFLAFAKELDPESDSGKLILTLLPESGMSDVTKLDNLRSVAFKKDADPSLQTRALFHLLRTSRHLSDLEKSQKILQSESLPFQNELQGIFAKSALSMGFKVGSDRQPASEKAQAPAETDPAGESP
ncbi:MAG: RDD family protein [Bdellovibrio sp.]|jgi:uncharacterized RDD family membrane protein YckC